MVTPCLTIACVDGFKVSTEKPTDPRAVLFLAQVAADHAEAHKEQIERMMSDLILYGSSWRRISWLDGSLKDEAMGPILPR